MVPRLVERRIDRAIAEADLLLHAGDNGGGERNHIVGRGRCGDGDACELVERFVQLARRRRLEEKES